MTCPQNTEWGGGERLIFLIELTKNVTDGIHITKACISINSMGKKKYIYVYPTELC